MMLFFIFFNNLFISIFLGHDNSNTAREFIEYIGKAVIERCASIIQEANFMTFLSYGSQARKTGSDKEMVLSRVMRKGVNFFF